MSPYAANLLVSSPASSPHPASACTVLQAARPHRWARGPPWTTAARQAKGLLEGTGSEPADQLGGEEYVQDQDRQHGQGQRRQDGVPVADELTDELLCAERDRLCGLSRRQNQRKPKVVPDRNH